MAIEKERAVKIQSELTKLFQSDEVKIEIRSDANEVVVMGKSLTLRSHHLESLAKVINGHAASFGRSGANFRMIIW